MKRSELYEKVWASPMTKLAAELGISDVGLAKACRRHAVPVPPRGFWAKLKAGQKPPRTALPTPELDVVVHFATSDPEERARQQVIERRRVEMLRADAASAERRPPLEFTANLEGAHPLVKATQRYCERIPAMIERSKRRGVHAWSQAKPEDMPPLEQHGRYNLFHRGFLNINASLASMDWILRFHATILRGLTDGGMTIARREASVGRFSRQADEAAVEMRFKGETLTFSFSEGYRRIRLDAAEIARRKKESPWASEYETRPSGNLTFSIRGSEHQASKGWQGTQEKLQGLADEIVRTAFKLMSLQPQLRREREERAATARRAEELRAQEERHRAARAEQLKQAFLMMEADACVRHLKAFLDRLEQNAAGLQPPLDERAKVWVEVVRRELEARNPADEILRECLSVPCWGSWPPAWWPREHSHAQNEG
ncbi:hypothetical protein J2W39_006551 [Variovorax paradoxus]|uniref:Uncharacterized protein n=1 Tax=Variovorax paradoxus TaxID=34073 RepID=A0AAW8ETI5_VARPD|nr:hypothetical protein [Variovorax paradoxus]MDP9975262.1 hypothetical protein [Variovorax paradoxus]